MHVDGGGRDGSQLLCPVFRRPSPEHGHFQLRLERMHGFERFGIEARNHDPCACRPLGDVGLDSTHQLVERLVVLVLLDLDIGAEPQFAKSRDGLGQGRDPLAGKPGIEPGAGVQGADLCATSSSTHLAPASAAARKAAMVFSGAMAEAPRWA
ncbi:hypothetical protein D3C87_1397680 [compost metagenome]